MNTLSFIPLEKEHIEIVRNWRNSEAVSKYMYTSEIITEEQQLKWFERISQDLSQKYWVIYKNDTPIGLISLYSIKSEFKTCYWAYYIGNTEKSGAGIGAKIEYKFLNIVFEEMNFNKLICEVFTFNETVIKLHEKFGFRREGYFRQHIFKDNQFYDVISMALFKSEWACIKDFYTKLLIR